MSSDGPFADKTKRSVLLRMAGTGFALAKYLQFTGIAIQHPDVSRFVKQILDDQHTLRPPKEDVDFVVVEQDEKGFSLS